MSAAAYTAAVLAEQEELIVLLRRRISAAERYKGWSSPEMKAAAIADYSKRLSKAKAWVKLLRERQQLEIAEAMREVGRRIGH